MKNKNFKLNFNVMKYGTLILLLLGFFCSRANAQAVCDCNTAGLTAWGSNPASVTNLSAVLPSGILTNTCVVVHGTLNVDLPGFTMTGSTLLMQTTSVINLTYATGVYFSLNNSRLIRCGTSWQGIRLLSINCVVDVNTGSLISGADVAVMKDISLNSWGAAVFVSSSTLDNNTIGISMGGPIQVVCNAATFDNGTTAFDLFDFDNATFIITNGCVIQNQASFGVKIGNSGAFDTSPKVGTVSIRNSSFNSNTVGISINYVFYDNRITGNTFSNHADGIVGHNTAFFISSNLMIAAIAGIDIDFPRYFSTYVGDNIIQNATGSGFSTFGIRFGENNANLPLTIINNRMTNYSAWGVRLINSSLLSNSNASIQTNIVNSSIRSGGIQLIRVSTSTVRANSIVVGDGGTALNSDGIFVSTGTNNVIYDNVVNGNPTRFGAGIRAEDAPENTYRCNWTDDTDRGFHGSMTCSNSTLRYNNFGTQVGVAAHRNGLQVDRFSEIGLQTYLRNKWLSNYANLGAEHLDPNMFVVGLSQFRVETVLGTVYHPTNSGLGFFVNPTPITVEDEAVCQHPDTGGDEYGREAQNLLNLILFEGGVSQELKVMQWEGWRYAFGLLTRKPAYLSTSPTFAAFYAEHLNGNIGKFQAIEDNWTNKGSTQPYPSAGLEALRIAIEEGFANEDNSQAHKDRVIEYRAKVMANQEYQLALAQEQLALLGQIQPNANYEANLKISNEVYFRTLAQGSKSISNADATTVTELSNDCPYTAGVGVLIARSLYNQLIDKTYVFENQCGDSEPRSVAVNEQNSTLSVSPNPASEQVLIRYSLQKDGPATVEFVNSLGIVVETIIATGNNQLVLDVSKYPSGIYNARLIENGHLIQTQKVCIVK